MLWQTVEVGHITKVLAIVELLMGAVKAKLHDKSLRFWKASVHTHRGRSCRYHIILCQRLKQMYHAIDAVCIIRILV